MKRKEIRWAIEKTLIEHDIQEDHGQKLLKDMKEIDEKEPLSGKQKLTLLDLYMKHCHAICLTEEYYRIQLENGIEEYAKEELLGERMRKTMLNKLRG